MKYKKQKNKLIRIWEILRQDTDRAHPIGTVALMQRLGEEGIHVERKTVYDDIRLLCEMGYPVHTIRRRTNEYYAEDSSFSVAELRLLIDSVQSASFLSKRKSKELANKVAALAGANKGETLRGTTTILAGTDNDSDELWRVVGVLQQAIADSRRVTFRYFDYDVHKARCYRTRSDGSDVYLFDPCALVYTDNNYYLVGVLDGKDNYSSYRIDRLGDICPLPDKRALPPWTKQRSVADYCKQKFGMFAGEGVRATFLCRNEVQIINIVLSRFGFDTKLTLMDDEHFFFTATVQISPQFYSWLVGLEGKVLLYAPQDALVAYRDYLHDQMTKVDALADKR